MDWLLHNPVADLPGPLFLLVYEFFIIAAAVWTYRSIGSKDTTDIYEPPEIPKSPDPYEIAYLRGGVNETLRVVLFSLYQRGFVEEFEQMPSRFATKIRTIRQVADAPSEDDLRPIERDVYKACRAPFAPAEVFKKTALIERLTAHCSLHEKTLRADELLQPDAVKAAAWPTWRAAMAFLLMLGGYKFVVGIMKHHWNLGFLILSFLGAAIVLAITVAVVRNRRVSKRGKVYLTRLKLAFTGLKTQEHPRQAFASYDPATMLLIGIYGIGALKNTAYSGYASLFATSSSGCGGGCGGGGEGCGGGCGGGGCGGCGG